MNQDFLSCDWGTSSFRLRRVSGPERTVIREIHEQAGVKSLYEEATRSGAESEAGRAGVFANFLRHKLEELRAGEKTLERTLPLVISGMASSSVGWRELPYAKTPFPINGRGLHSNELDWHKPEWVGPTHLISGLATAYDMMRGEEMEITGLMSDASLAALRERSLLILPGTHSKHIWIEDQSVVDFRTFMTGELFEVLGRQSLLKASVDAAGHTRSDSLSEPDRAAFQEGVSWAKAHGLAGGLFRVRTRAVLDHRPLADNTYFFSGLLIGAELESIVRNAENRPVVLGATRGLSELYGLALEMVAGRAIQWIQLPPEQVERATIAAHALFLQNRTAGETK
ncbi:MAG: 2-dehydro-3-deoxygalactonokinase [Verrucomicrobiota bacterium]